MKLIKDYTVLNLDPTLIAINEDIDAIGGEGVITSAHRPGDPGVHGQLPCRGLDRRCRNAGLGNAIKQYINRRWEYDPDRPEMEVCIFHKCDEYGWHLHTQTHKNTRRRP